MGRLRYKGYVGSVEYSEEDNCFAGSVLGLRKATIIYEGDSVESLKKDFEASVDLYLDDCKERGICPEVPYSGKLLLRISPALHGEIAERASNSGLSLNEFINRALQAAVL